jgi:hypothetical protein
MCVLKVKEKIFMKIDANDPSSDDYRIDSYSTSALTTPASERSKYISLACYTIFCGLSSLTAGVAFFYSVSDRSLPGQKEGLIIQGLFMVACGVRIACLAPSVLR